jgi:hypothetical protein
MDRHPAGLTHVTIAFRVPYKLAQQVNERVRSLHVLKQAWVEAALREELKNPKWNPTPAVEGHEVE